MPKLKQILITIFNRKFFKKVIAYGLLILFIILFKDFLGIFFLTFVFAYIFYSIGMYLEDKILLFVDKNIKHKSTKKILKRFFDINILILFEYIIFIGVIIFILSGLLPKLISELSEFTTSVPLLTDHVTSFTSYLQEIKNNYVEIGGTLSEVFSSRDVDVLLGILNKLKMASLVFLQVLISLILSYVFIVDRKKLKKYLGKIKESNFKFLYFEYKIIFDRIVKSFGLILKAQALIAFANAVLTILGLYIIGFMNGLVFPFILTLGLLVFLLGFVPILGVFLSSIPIIIIAYSFVGGFQAVLSVVFLIMIVHIVEAYYLNPKILSRFLELPVSLTFVILIVSEHVFGFAGLLIGVSLFYFSMGLLNDADRVIAKTKKKVYDLNEKLK